MLLPTEEENVINIYVLNNGKGFPDDFDSISNSNCFGLKLIDTLSTQLDGELTISSNGGTTLGLIFEKEAPDGSKGSITNSEHNIGAKV